MLQLKGLDCDQTLPSLELNTWILGWKNVETLTCLQQQPQGPKTHRNKSTNRSLAYCTLLGDLWQK